jgi:5-formyltetrahydrofolate cyclo-ligase
MVQEEKAKIRAQMLKKRDEISEEERAQKNISIMKRLLEEEHFLRARTVALYMSKGSEVETQEILLKVKEEGKEICLPVVVSADHLELYCFESFEDLQKGKFGVLEPKGRKPPSREPDIIIIPGVSFGLCMHRLGYGKGYYDRLLARLPSYRIGICFDFQLVDNLPKHEDDQRMHKIITEKREIE